MPPTLVELGRLDIVVANAGVISPDSNRITRTQAFRDVLGCKSHRRLRNRRSHPSLSHRRGAKRATATPSPNTEWSD
jgi:hypothetical protein